MQPSKSFMQETDSKMVSINKSCPNVFYMDVETGKTVKEIETKNRIEDICPHSKNSQISGEQEFFGVSDMNILHFDPRTKNGIEEDRKYSKKMGFNKIVAAYDGKVAVGNKDGEIRLIQKVGDRNAKNLIPS